ncbi:MAG: hypothetical protein ABIR18_02785 [Chitinophagaceae bacterium]
MTPELKISCEVVFQEHKTSGHPITWNKNVFRERMSMGLVEMAKETLVQKKIIYFPKPTKRSITVLNPIVAAATTFEEAVAMAQSKTSFVATEKVKQPVYTATSVSGFNGYADKHKPQLIKNTGNTVNIVVEEKWYLKPLFYYVVWPVCALIASILIAYLMSQGVEMMYR